MATSDSLRALFKSFSQRDNVSFVAAANALVEEERRKGHRLLARDLQRILENGNGRPQSLLRPDDVPLDKERGVPLFEIEEPDVGWERIVLRPDIRSSFSGIVDEYRARDVLRSYGLSPKQKLLFFGPPGCGKTLGARVLSGVLGLPLIYVRFDSVVSSYLGETAANLRKVFDYVARGQWVVFFDEFDAIGKGRDNPTEHGELKRVVNSLLQLVDHFSGDSLLIAATNHESLLDPALWRRFDEICFFGMPSTSERKVMLTLYLAGLRHPSVDLASVARKTQGMSGSDIERVCVEAAKNAILDHRCEVSESDLELGLRRQRQRMRLARGASSPVSRQSDDE